MVPVCRVGGGFEAQVLAARLGAAGVLVELRGGGVSSLWPGGAVEVLVASDDLVVARELLLEDSVEEVYASVDGSESAALPGGRVLPWWVVASAVVLLAAFVLAETVGRLT